jgi:formamidopyrimidine-DNA glycosylase
LHHRIAGTHAESDEILQGTSPQGLGRALKDNQFDSSRRHGKYLFIELHNGGWLGMHFGMTGSLAYFGSDSQVPDYTRLLLTFNNGYRLAYVAPRKPGKVFLTDTVQAFIEDHGLGPDALAPSPAEFKELAQGRRSRPDAHTFPLAPAPRRRPVPALWRQGQTHPGRRP